MSEGFTVISVNPYFPRVKQRGHLSTISTKLYIIIIKKVNPIKIANDAQMKHLTYDEHEMESIRINQNLLTFI